MQLTHFIIVFGTMRYDSFLQKHFKANLLYVTGNKQNPNSDTNHRQTSVMLIQKDGEPFTLAQLAFSYASLADFPLNYNFITNQTLAYTTCHFALFLKLIRRSKVQTRCSIKSVIPENRALCERRVSLTRLASTCLRTGFS